MNKAQLLEKSRQLGKEIAQLMNEFRNSSGEFADHDEAYFEEYFAGLLMFLCTGDGELRVEYNKTEDPEDTAFIDGEVVLNSEVQYPFSDVHIHDFKAVEEHTSHKEGRVDKTYVLKMDPITYIYYIMGTDFAGKKIFDGAGMNEAVI